MTTVQYLNTVLTDADFERRGLKKIWVIRQMGLGRSLGYQMLNDGILPKDLQVQKRAIKKLTAIIERTEKEILVTHVLSDMAA